MNILDNYFKRPIIWDYIVAIVVSSAFGGLYYRNVFSLIPADRSIALTTDISTVGLTSAGFILTLLTVLITFKSSSKISKENYTEDDSLFDLFFASDLYFQTIKILKNCIKSLIFISILGFSIKMVLPNNLIIYTFFYNLIGLVIVSLTLWRCLLVLSKILKMQK